MIRIIAKLFGSSTSGQIDALAGQVVERSKDNVCQLVSTQVESMAFSEARGYVRARAARIVRKQARIAIGNLSDSDQVLLDAVSRQATERLVPLVIREAAVGVPRLAPVRLAA